MLEMPAKGEIVPPSLVVKLATSSLFSVTLELATLVLRLSIITNVYDYGDALRKSMLFYQANRSGKLKDMAPELSWRKDSALNDRGENGEDLTGGYFDAGDYIKFNFPQAYSMTVLSWGIISQQEGYENADALDDARQTIRWGTDYLLKCHVSSNTLYGQVGEEQLDHDYWGRPEDMTMKRPAHKIDASHPGSDLAGETAAALAAASIVFKDVDKSYSQKLVSHAKTLFDFANNHRGKYSDSIKDAKANYGSSGYKDEIVWAAIWVYKATNDKTYLEKAEQLYKEFKLQNTDNGFSWDDKHAGVNVLLAQLTNKQQYKDKTKDYCDYVVYDEKKTPKGLVFISEWGSLCSAANAVYICMEAAQMGIHTDEYHKFAKKQIGYMLGDTGRSFVVGFGVNPPTHVQHASSSCPDKPAKCDWDTYSSSKPNAHIVYGALAGGPDENDKYTDKRDDYVGNEVAIDYNAAYQGVLAAFKKLGW